MATLVTGGTGFIGAKLTRRLRATGETVHLLSRKDSNRKGLEGDGVEVFFGDVTDRDSLRAPMAGCRTVFHLAGYARNWARDPATYFRVNVDGFKNVAAAALAAGVRKMVFTSTSLTLGPSDGGVNDEQTPRRTAGFLTEYERTKYLAEVEADRFVRAGLPLVIVNPTRVYGPGRLTEGNSVTRMVQMFLDGRFPFIPGTGAEVGNYVYVDDVVEGHLAAAIGGRVGERYLLAGENASLDTFFRLLALLTGRKPPRRHVPAWMARVFARLEELKAKALGGYPLISPGWMATFLCDWAFSNRKASEELGCSFRGLRQGLELTLNWLASGNVEEP